MADFTNEEIRKLREIMRAFDKVNLPGGLVSLRDDGKLPESIDLSLSLGSLEKELELTSKYPSVYVDVSQDTERRIKTRKTWADSSKTKAVFTTQVTYKEDGNIIEKKVRSHIDNTTLTAKYSYDSNGNVTTITKKISKDA